MWKEFENEALEHLQDSTRMHLEFRIPQIAQGYSDIIVIFRSPFSKIMALENIQIKFTM